MFGHQDLKWQMNYNVRDTIYNEVLRKNYFEIAFSLVQFIKNIFVVKITPFHSSTVVLSKPTRLFLKHGFSDFSNLYNILSHKC